MSVHRQDLEELYSLFSITETETRDANPEFLGGFQTLSLQAARLHGTIERLKSAHQNVVHRSQILSKDLQSWRRDNPMQKIRGVKQSRPYHTHKRRTSKTERFTETVLASTTRDEKVEFERRDYALRNKIEGLQTLKGILADCQAMLKLRLMACKNLERIGQKLDRGFFNVEDGQRLGMAYDEVVDGTMELKEMEEMLEVLEKTF